MTAIYLCDYCTDEVITIIGGEQLAWQWQLGIPPRIYCDAECLVAWLEAEFHPVHNSVSCPHVCSDCSWEQNQKLQAVDLST